jgi:hypothetical protein
MVAKIPAFEIQITQDTLEHRFGYEKNNNLNRKENTIFHALGLSTAR